MPEHELVIRITAPTEADGQHWATTIRDLVTAEYGTTMRLTFDGPRLVNAPGSTVEQLPDEALAGHPEHGYVSTACHHELHNRCRRSCKFCVASCACDCHTEGPEND